MLSFRIATNTLYTEYLRNFLNAIILIFVLSERECFKDGIQSLERRYFINSLPADAKPFATAVREHWGVENPLHWRLDVIFGDDASRIKGNAATIMTSIRHLCLNLFQQESSSISCAKKKRKAAWNDAYRAKVMLSSTF